MRSPIAMLGALGFALASTQALAGEVLDGTVDIIDEAAKMITVDGQVFVLEGTHDLTNLEIGELVTISYEEKDGQNVITSIDQAEPNE